MAKQRYDGKQETQSAQKMVNHPENGTFEANVEMGEEMGKMKAIMEQIKPQKIRSWKENG